MIIEKRRKVTMSLPFLVIMRMNIVFHLMTVISQCPVVLPRHYVYEYIQYCNFNVGRTPFEHVDSFAHISLSIPVDIFIYEFVAIL